MTLRSLFVACAAGLCVPAQGIELADPETYAVENVWSVSEIGLPDWNLHGMVFDPTGDLLYVVVSPGINVCGSVSQLWRLEVDRAPDTEMVVGLADPVEIFGATLPCLGPGWEAGPEGTLFYSYVDSRTVAQRPGGFDGSSESRFTLSNLAGRPESGGLTFSPHILDVSTGFGLLQTSSWTLSTHQIHNVYLEPLGDGLYTPVRAELFASRPGPASQDGIGGQLQYSLTGPDAGDLLYANFNSGQVMLMRMDKETGFAIDQRNEQPRLGTPVPMVEPFVAGLGRGPYSLEVDPRGGAVFVGTMTDQGTPADSIIQIGGFPRPGAPAPTFLRGDANADRTRDVSDALFILHFLFVGGERPTCEKSADTNDSGTLDVSDALFLLNHVFLGGPPPAEPKDACGQDPTPDELACETPASCL